MEMTGIAKGRGNQHQGSVQRLSDGGGPTNTVVASNKKTAATAPSL
jgi:hypothetical protein